MIRVCVKRVAGQVTKLVVSGHAGSAPHGEDIICAAVSVLVQTYLFSLQRLLQLDVAAEILDGYFSLILPTGLAPAVQEKVSLLTESTLVGLAEIDKSYPGFLQVSEE
ncbi:MAG TPA: ribosomal-processing cysteine protease Prp [Oscillospiraceae bacterium]|nr:ribosomal-processing cysteine protease Prp [Oscillospiraceae bacterium]